MTLSQCEHGLRQQVFKLFKAFYLISHLSLISMNKKHFLIVSVLVNNTNTAADLSITYRKPVIAVLVQLSEDVNELDFTCSKLVKDAVCRILTLLKHKITIICLHIFKKHIKLTHLFIWKTMLQSVILLWKCAFRAAMSVYVLVCEICPLQVYPIVFRHPGLPVGGKHFLHHHVCSFPLVSLIWQTACASSLRRMDRVKKTLSNILKLDCNT